MKTYVINLDRNPERLAFMTRQFAAAGISAERFPAVYGAALAPEERRRGFSRVRSLLASKKRMSDAEIGVAMSHAGVYRRFLESGEPYALVFEDDVAIGPKFPETLALAEKALDPARPQVVVFSGYGIEGGGDAPPEIRREKSIWCADAYCITRAGAELILRANWPVITVADSFKRWARRFGLELYRAFPISVKQDDVTFKSENLVLPKSNFLLRNLLWVADWLAWKITGR